MTLQAQEIEQIKETIKFYVELGNEIFNTDLTMPLINFNLKGTCGADILPHLKKWGSRLAIARHSTCPYCFLN
jgi:hypothetical protein